MQLSERFVAQGFIGSFREQPIFSTSLRIAAVAAMLMLVLFASQPAQAQTNGKIAYSDVIERGPSNNQWVRSAIFTYPGKTQLTHPVGPVGRDSDTAPAWSPDGKKIAWVRYVQEINNGGQWTIMIADADGANERIIARQRYEDGTPAGQFANCTPLNLTWSPDSLRVGIGSRCREGSTTFIRDFIQGINSPVSSLGRFTNMNLGFPGFDWSTNGVLYRCDGFGLPVNLNNLFCVMDQSGYIFLHTAIEEDPSDVQTQGSVVGMPRWKYSAAGPRVAFVYSSLDPSNALRSSQSIYTIEPSRTNQQPIGAFLGRFSGAPEFVSCTPRNQPTRFQPRYSYEQIAPSPDGKYIAARRTETTWDRLADGSNCYYRQINNGIYVLRKGGIVQNVAALGDDVRDPAWQPSPANLSVVFKYQQSGQVRELHGMKVQLLKLDSPDDTSPQDTGKVPSNPAGGQYQFEDVLPGTYHVRATLKDEENFAFDIRYDYIGGVSADAPVNADFKVVVEPDAEYVERHFRFSGDEPGLVSANIDTLGKSRLEGMAAIYYNFAQFVGWVKTSLTTNLGPLRLAVHAFATSDPYGGNAADYGAAYFSDSTRIILSKDVSSLDERDDDADECPINCEFHEYAHHLDYVNRTGVFACTYLAGDAVHGGYANSSTCDSLREGIATFLPTMFTKSPDYAGMFDLEAHTKAWNVGFGDGSKRYSREDFAAAALLWDLVDDDPDVLYTSGITPGASRLHVPVAYADNIAVPLTTLWQILGTELPSNLRDLQQYFDSSNTVALIDLDYDTINDVNQFDPLFLMHGFYPTTTDATTSTAHAYHYDIGRARSAGETTNADVGLSNHFAFNLLGLTGPDRLYREHHPSGDVGFLGLSVRDSSGTALSGADVYIDLHYPGSDQRLTRHLLSGDGKLVRLQLPQYFDYLPVDGSLPACDPITNSELYVSVTVTAELNGHVSTNTASFDNCEYLTAMLAADPGSAALSYTLEFPEDSTPPTTTAQTFGKSQVNGNNATESWGVELSCSDPEDSGFASGCNRIEYRINGGAPQTYADEPFVISGNGDYDVEFWSTDAAANQEPAQQIQLTIGTPPPSVSAFTPASGPAGTSVAISGADFTGVTAVNFNGTPATFSVASSTSINATVPAGATSGPISVTGPGGTTSSTTDFTVPPLPVITDFSPPFAAQGFPVTITGSNLSGVTRVGFNGTITGPQSATATEVRVVVPFGATSGPLTVIAPGGTGTSPTNFVVTNGIPPSITSFSPVNGAIGASVTLKGSNLTGASSVTFNGVSAAFRYKGSAIVAIVPAGSTTGPIRVTTAGGWATTTGNFVVNLPPVIQSISPTSGIAGSTVTLTGSNFTGATGVKFGNTSASFVVVSADTITATVPGRAKSGPISVTTAGGTATSSVSFTVVK